ncbi:MAG: DUF2026 family protein [Candidatus Methylumidiphilus sp.]
MKVKMQDYDRIYKTINTIILNEDADPTAACTFFAFYGASILEKHYKIDAKAVAGTCMYHLGGEENVLCFGQIYNSNLIASPTGFHCWILAEDYFIDFMAPNFPDLLKRSGQSFSCKPKMMQKPLSKMAGAVDGLQKKGDYYFNISTEMTNNRMQYLLSSKAYLDLEDICINWYKKPPKNMAKHIQISDGKGNQNLISLTGKSVVGAW